MTSKSALYALAVLVLTGSMAVAALADDRGMNAYGGPADIFVSAQPEQGEAQPDAGEIREPMETGAVPGRLEGSSELHNSGIGDEPTVEFGGLSFRPGIDTGP